LPWHVQSLSSVGRGVDERGGAVLPCREVRERRVQHNRLLGQPTVDSSKLG
jgi:hypothetical protein